MKKCKTYGIFRIYILLFYMFTDLTFSVKRRNYRKTKPKIYDMIFLLSFF